MSAFLGPIHTWLYNKIKLQDELVNALIDAAVNENVAGDEIKAMLTRRYGELEKGDLEEICDPNNIHGWLQDRVSLVENRLAFAVTYLTMENSKNIEFLEKAAYSAWASLEGEILTGVASHFFEGMNLARRSLSGMGKSCTRATSFIAIFAAIVP